MIDVAEAEQGQAMVQESGSAGLVAEGVNAVRPAGTDTRRTCASVGSSFADDSAEAGRDAAAAALATLDGAAPKLALVFASAEHDHAALLGGVRDTLPGVPLVGCSGEGIIAANESIEAMSAAAVMLIGSERMRFETFVIEDYATDPAAAGVRLATLVNSHIDEARCLCVLPDGLLGNCTALLDALRTTLTRELPIVGGAAADAMTFERTFQYSDTTVISGGLVAFLVLGDVDVEVAVSHGCMPIGLERQVTSADNGWIREIDNQTAWSVFKEYLDEDTQDLNADGIVHLCIGEPLRNGGGEYDPFVIRTPLRLDAESGALFFPGGGLTEGTAVQITRRDADKIRRSAKECAEGLLATHDGRPPDLVLQFDCAGRGRILWGGCAAAEIVEPLRRTLGPSTPWIGFHTYGEIAPIAGRPYYHNYTVALCAFYER